MWKIQKSNEPAKLIALLYFLRIQSGLHMYNHGLRLKLINVFVYPP